MTTELQQQRQLQAGQVNLEAIQGINITPNQGAVVPNVMQLQGLLEQMQAAKNSLPNVNPPSEDEIRKTSWIASGVIGLLGAIVSGNAAGGIAAGMVAALAIHDRGHDLRQRSQSVMELHKQGYSNRAIMKWYEDGDNAELDKEAQRMQQDASQEAGLIMQGERMSQQDERFIQQMNMQGARLENMERHEVAMEGIARQRLDKMGQAGGWTALGHLNSLGRALYTPYKERVSNLNNKQNYVDQLQTALAQMRTGNPVSFNAVLTGLAGMDNPNAVPKEGAIERLEDVGGLPERLKNALARQKGGVFDAETVQQLHDFAAAHQADIDTQRQKIATAVRSSAAGELASAGIADPANRLATSVALQVAAGQVADDPMATTAPILMTNDQQTTQAEKGEPEKTQPEKKQPNQQSGNSDVDTVMAKYGHVKK